MLVVTTVLAGESASCLDVGIAEVPACADSHVDETERLLPLPLLTLVLPLLLLVAELNRTVAASSHQKTDR
jgi:hypothetical protein